MDAGGDKYAIAAFMHDTIFNIFEFPRVLRSDRERALDSGVSTKQTPPAQAI